MSTVIVVNENDEAIGAMPTSEAHRNGTPHRIAVVYVENPVRQFLVQIRMSGALDHSSAGHVDPGESYIEAARRELAEELGIAGVELKKIGHGVCHNETSEDGGLATHVFDVFSCVGEPGQLQEDEVKGVYWADPQEVLSDMQTGKSGARYAGGFRVSLPIYMEARRRCTTKEAVKSAHEFSPRHAR
jgi:isopentenyldiphosphate isomerase